METQVLFVSEKSGLVSLHAFRIFGRFWLEVPQLRPWLRGFYVLISFACSHCCWLCWHRRLYLYPHQHSSLNHQRALPLRIHHHHCYPWNRRARLQSTNRLHLDQSLHYLIWLHFQSCLHHYPFSSSSPLIWIQPPSPAPSLTWGYSSLQALIPPAR